MHRFRGGPVGTDYFILTGCDMDAMIELAGQLGQSLAVRGEWVSTAESCTGGLISSVLTDVPGSSAWFAYGFVTYSNQAKQTLLGVSTSSLQQYGAVSEAVVREMAQGALAKSGAHWAVAVSGIAGPGGGSPDKPVGTVWIALAGPAGAGRSWVSHFEGDRTAVRQQTVQAALTQLCLLVEAQPLVG
jgi:nicotinamide-nucleotide amidase